MKQDDKFTVINIREYLQQMMHSLERTMLMKQIPESQEQNYSDSF